MLHVLSTLFIMRRRSILALVTLALPSIALAVSFPDVSSTHIYREQIETLADKGIVKGSPDGSFNPGGTINRAELLTLLYRAAGKTPGTPSKSCFKDVSTDAWYSAVVCDSSKKGYVGGYPDGNFRPGNAVNRVESLKMIHTVLGLSVNASASTSPLKMYTDVSLTAWYTPYMASAYAHKVLPVAGQSGTLFMPEAALSRSEAAAYIFNGLGLTLKGYSSSASSTSSATTRSSASSKSTNANQPVIQEIVFPFDDNGTFENKVSKVYMFTLNKPTVASLRVNVDTGDSVDCRLQKIDTATSFTLEYYIGHKIGNICEIRVSLSSGNYQFEIEPATKNAHFDLSAKNVSGDGNDGFNQAAKLLNSSPKTSNLEVDDYADFFTFTLTESKQLAVTVTDSGNTSCIIYPMADVDIFGFSGPNCNALYEFPKGTYYIGVMRRNERDEKESFTIRYE